MPTTILNIIDSLIMAKVILNMINLEVKVNTREMKDQLQTINIGQFNRDLSKMLTYIEELYSTILAENETY